MSGVRRSPEIEAIVLRWTGLIAQHRTNDLPHFLSQDDALVYVGSSDGEIWRGQVLRDGIADHLSEVPDIVEDDRAVEAWENGDTGWALYTCRFSIPGTGASGVHRVTFVFVMERGGWKMVQHHISQPDSNFEKLGIEHKALNALVAAAQAGSHDFGEAGLASIMFTDVVGSTALASAMGDGAWLRLLDAHTDDVASCIRANKGTLVKSLGDGTMSAFTSAGAALEAAKAIQMTLASRQTEPRLALRIGIHTGEVIRARDDFFGTVVNKAARITATAGAAEVRLSDATRAMVAGSPDFTFSEATTTELKGLEGMHVTYKLDLG